MKCKLICFAVAFNIFSTFGNVLLNLGHTSEIILLNSSGDFLASQDSYNYWAVWNMRTKQQLITGHLDTSRTWPKIALKNNILVVPTLDGFCIYHLPDTTPKIIKTDPIDSLQLTSNGKFIWSGSNRSLRV